MAASKRSENVKLIVAICVVVGSWGLCMVYRRPLQARYLALRASWSSDPAVRTDYARRLGYFGPDGLGALEQLLADEGADLRALAVMQLPDVKHPRAGALLRDALDDPDPTVRHNAILGLGRSKDPAAVPVLGELAAGPDFDSAIAAIHSLGRIPDPAAVEVLLGLATSHASLPARAAAIDALAFVRADAAIEPLIEMLADETPLEMHPADDVTRGGMAAEFIKELVSRGFPVPAPRGPRKTTIADVAADALRRIAGQGFGFTTTQPADRKEAIIRMWRRWLAGPHPA